MTSSISSNIELNSLEANKGAALKQLCGLLGVGLEETLAFGDGSNDPDDALCGGNRSRHAQRLG